MLYILKNGASIFKRKQEDILSGAFVIAVSVLISSLLGFVRLRLLTAYFGDEIVSLDSYFVASRLSESLFEVLIFGSISLAFIPVFSQYLSREKLEKAWSFASTMISLAIIVFLALTVLIFIFAPFISQIIAPGLVSQAPETKVLIARLMRIMVLSQSFFVASIFLTGILQSFQRFIIPAVASIFYNLGIIISIIFLSPVMGIYAPAFGMVIGALLHLLIQLPLIFSLGFKFRLNLDIKHKNVKETLALMWPRSVALGALRIFDLLNIALASTAAIGSVTAFSLAQILQFLPITLFAGSIAQAALPALSLEIHAQRKDQFRKVFTEAFHQIIFLILPAAAILAILRIPVVRLVFGSRQLPWETTVLAGRILIAFSISIGAQAVSLLLTRAFYAHHDSITPVRVNLGSIAISIALSILFVPILKLSIIYLALAFSIGATINSILLLYLLDKKVNFDKKYLILPVAKMLIISIITAVSLYIPMKLLDQLVFDTTRTIGLILLTSVATIVGLSVYATLSWILKVEEAKIFWHFGKRVLSWPNKILASGAPIDVQKPNP